MSERNELNMIITCPDDNEVILEEVPICCVYQSVLVIKYIL